MSGKKSVGKTIVTIICTLFGTGLVTVAIIGAIFGGLSIIDEAVEDSRGTVHMEIQFAGNLILDKYNVEFLIDNESIDIIKQGTIYTIDLPLSKGSHTVTFCQEGIPSVKGSAEFNVEGDMDITYSIKCHTAVIDVKQL